MACFRSSPSPSADWRAALKTAEQMDWARFCRWLAPRLGAPSLLAADLPEPRKDVPPTPEDAVSFTRAVHDYAAQGPYPVRCAAAAAPADAALAVIRPRDGDGLAEALCAAARNDIGLVSENAVKVKELFDGDTRGAVLDLSALDEIGAINADLRTVTAQGGVTGPALEAFLNEAGWTLGHAPINFEETLHDWIAAPATGDRAARYGDQADWLASTAAQTPAGAFDDDVALLFTEGFSGAVVAKAVLRIRPLPACEAVIAAWFDDLETALAAAEALHDDGAAFAGLNVCDAAAAAVRTAAAEAARRAPFTPRDIRLRNAFGALLTAFVEGSETQTRAHARHIEGVLKRFGARLDDKTAREAQAMRFFPNLWQTPLFTAGAGLAVARNDVPWADVLQHRTAAADDLASAIDAETTITGARTLCGASVNLSRPNRAEVRTEAFFVRDYQNEEAQAGAVAAILDAAPPLKGLKKRLVEAKQALFDPKGVLSGPLKPAEPNETASEPSPPLDAPVLRRSDGR